MWCLRADYDPKWSVSRPAPRPQQCFLARTPRKQKTLDFYVRARLRRHASALAARRPRLRRARDPAPAAPCALPSPLAQESGAKTARGGFSKMTSDIRSFVLLLLLLLLSSHIKPSRSHHPVPPSSVLIYKRRGQFPWSQSARSQPSVPKKTITWPAESQNKTTKTHKGEATCTTNQYRERLFELQQQ